jgi:rubrerythrin
MQYTTSLYKVAQLAAKAEEAGESYYRKIATLVKDANVQKVCLHFAEQEREHKDTFNKIAEEAKKDAVERNFDRDIVALMNGGIKQIMETGFQAPDFDYKSMGVAQCLKLALHLEKETVAIYEEIRQRMDTNYHRTLLKIIKEENEHATSIEKVLKQKESEV